VRQAAVQSSTMQRLLSGGGKLPLLATAPELVAQLEPDPLQVVLPQICPTNRLLAPLLLARLLHLRMGLPAVAAALEPVAAGAAAAAHQGQLTRDSSMCRSSNSMHSSRRKCPVMQMASTA